MSGTPRTDAWLREHMPETVSLVARHPDSDARHTLKVPADFAGQLERELADCRAMLKSWYEAASPYATAEALREALAQRPEARAPEWKAVSADDPTRGVAWVDWDATHIGKIGVKGQRHILALPSMNNGEVSR